MSMKMVFCALPLLLSVGSVPLITGHYVFSRFMFNKTVTEQWEYVRNISIGEAADSGLWDQYMPLYDIYSEDIRCGRGAWVSGGETKTARVVAGDEVGFVVGRSADEPLEPYIIYHNGPGQAYLSKHEPLSSASSAEKDADLSSYTGSGPWYKIASRGALNDTWWMTRDQTGMNFTIPKTTPPGNYLLRVEHLYVRPWFNMTQFYVACAHVEILQPQTTGAGTDSSVKVPGDEYMVNFPGAYDLNDEGILVQEHIYEWPNSGLLQYKAPGPPVWTG
ncbi:lytic polysaccharide monooxygenase [Rhypophila decipiens]|uniref:lytic cellulose monooxygenase (C4-dehydrogenating) n=1 Tax=Rhypophila decipiens TaxID=261697 RepID=A0AAN6YAB1_9PEZI|nr:lytic polysaccharide monooxygenase [Rhypophila decipiens]